MKRTLPLLITFLFGLFMVGEYFIPHWRYHVWTGNFLEWAQVVSSAAYLMGILNLLQVNVPTVARRGEDWPYKLVMLGSLFITLLLGFIAGEHRQEDGQLYKWIYDAIYTPLSATMFALLAFYVASAAFRAFRARNLEAGLLLSAAALVMAFRVPLGEWIPVIGEPLSHFMNWILDVPNTAARRAIFIGGALGTIATGLRVILGLERSHLGE